MLEIDSKLSELTLKPLESHLDSQKIAVNTPEGLQKLCAAQDGTIGALERVNFQCFGWIDPEREGVSYCFRRSFAWDGIILLDETQIL